MDWFYFVFLKDFIYLFLQRGRKGEREEEKHQYVAASCASPIGDLARNLSVYPDWELNRWRFGSQAGAQSTEPHQPGLFLLFILTLLISPPKSLMYQLSFILFTFQNFFLIYQNTKIQALDSFKTK